MIRYGSVCSGIEAATAAWHPLGWEAAFFSEIEPFPRAVLSHHYPDVPLHGDFTTIGEDDYGAIDLLVGGTPCQSFSVAGLRGGLDDDRGNLALEFLKLAQRKRPRWVVWENVPGVLSSNGGRDFGSILGGLVELGYGFAYRVLDAQYFGVAQRRRRVFVVGCLGDAASAAAVLFERHSLQGHSAPSRKKGERTSDTLTVGANQCSGFFGDITEHNPQVGESVGSLCARTGRSRSVQDAEQGHIVPFDLAQITSKTNRSKAEDGMPAPTMSKSSHMHVTYAIQERAVCENPNAGPDGAGFRDDDAAYTLEARPVTQAIAYSIMPMNSGKDYKARETEVAQPLMAGGPVGGNQGGDYVAQPVASPTLRKGGDGGGQQPAVAFNWKMGAKARTIGLSEEQSPTLSTGADRYAVMVPSEAFQPTADCLTAAYGTKWNGNASATNGSLFAQQQSTVRRLTPVECERLQGFPDNFTAIPWRKKGAEDCPDGPRYKALGNSMAVPVMRWIGERIMKVEGLLND